MKDSEYRTTQGQIQTVAALLIVMDLSGFLARIESCEAIAPFVDPTLYMKGAKQLEEVKTIASALHEAQKKIRLLAPAEAK